MSWYLFVTITILVLVGFLGIYIYNIVSNWEYLGLTNRTILIIMSVIMVAADTGLVYSLILDRP